MIWFNLKKLENRISENKISEKEGYNYLLAYIVFIIVTLGIVTNNKSILNDNSLIQLLDIVITIIIAVWGLKISFNLNNKIDGKDFLKRYFAINWVVTIRLIIIGFITIFVIVFLAIMMTIKNKNYFNDFSEVIGFAKVIFNAIFNLIFYLLVINSFRRIKNKMK